MDEEMPEVKDCRVIIDWKQFFRKSEEVVVCPMGEPSDIIGYGYYIYENIIPDDSQPE